MDVGIGTAIAIALGLLIWWVTGSLKADLDDLEVRRATVEIAVAYRLHVGFDDCDLIAASAFSVVDALAALAAVEIHYPVRTDFSDWTIEYVRSSTRGGLLARISRMDGVHVIDQFVHKLQVAGLPHGQTFVTAAFGRSC